MMRINIYKLPFSWQFDSLNSPLLVEEKGYILSETFNREECWDLCNWSCWCEKKPKNLLSPLEVVNSDVIFHNPTDDTYHLALSFGWFEAKSLNEVIEYCKKKRAS